MNTYQWEGGNDTGMWWLAEYRNGLHCNDVAMIKFPGNEPATYGLRRETRQFGAILIPAPPGLALDELKAYVATLARMEN